MDSQLKIWLVLTFILLLARFVDYRTIHSNTMTGYYHERYYWRGTWLKWVPTAWFTLSLFLYLLK